MFVKQKDTHIATCTHTETQYTSQRAPRAGFQLEAEVRGVLQCAYISFIPRKTDI